MKWIKRFYYFGTAFLYVAVMSGLLGYMREKCWDSQNKKALMVFIAVFWPFVYPIAFICDWLDIDIKWEEYAL